MSAAYGAIWASLPVPALVVDAAGRIADANPPAEQFLNASARALAGASLGSRLRADTPLAETLDRVRADEAPVFITDARVTGAAAPPVRCDIRAAPLAGAPGHVLLLIAPRQIADLVGRAHAASAAARSAIGMAAMMSHEIKNPLAGITGAAQLLSMSLDGGDRELTDLIVAESRRIVALLDQLEQFGDLRPPRTRAVNIHDLADRARASASVGFAAHMRLLPEYDPSLPPARVDADQMLQVLLNLLRNAAEAAGPEGGTIRIRSFYDAGLRLRGPEGAGRHLPLQLEIVDDGPGIPPDLQAGIFDPFVSGRENGTGLGLALVGKIVGAHGGWIAVDSAPGRTVFRLSLPVASGEDGAGAMEGS